MPECNRRLKYALGIFTVFQPENFQARTRTRYILRGRLARNFQVRK